jgi:hypothetical protein
MASLIACLSEPAPLSIVFVTVIVLTADSVTPLLDGFATATRIAPTDRLIHIHIAIADRAMITLALRITLFPVRFIIISPDQRPVFAGPDDWS